MAGFAKDNSYGDLIYTNEDTRINQERQYFWEAFPAMASWDAKGDLPLHLLNADEMRQHTVEGQFEDYWRMLPTYQSTTPRVFRKSIEDALEDGDLVLKRCSTASSRCRFSAHKMERVLAASAAGGVSRL